MCSAIVLHTYDIGETDRLCVLLTKLHGKIVARARGVRECRSRMGGSILPLSRVTVTLQKAQERWYIQEARLVHACNSHQPILIQQGVEVLLLLVEDGEPVPEVFELLEEFIQMQPRTLIPFTMRLFYIMGVLPMNTEDDRFRRLSPGGQGFIQCCARIVSLRSLEDRFPHGDQSLVTFFHVLLEEQLPRPLHSSQVASAMSYEEGGGAPQASSALLTRLSVR